MGENALNSKHFDIARKKNTHTSRLTVAVWGLEPETAADSLAGTVHTGGCLHQFSRIKLGRGSEVNFFEYVHLYRWFQR